MNQKWKWAIIALAGTILIAALLGPRIPQAQSYHRFADQRTLLAIPRFFDVVSNIGFLIIGVWGTVFVLNEDPGAGAAFLTRKERWPYLCFFLGVLLTAFGSAYYHYAPDN